jgi:hypothetical protein
MSRRILYIIVGLLAVLLILVGISLFVFIPTLTAAQTTQTTPTAVPTQPAITPTRTVNPITKALKQYAPDIKNQIAQGLKLTPEQLTAQLQSGKTLSDVAAAQNVSTTQLQTILSNSLQASLKPAVDSGDITQKQLDNLTKRYEKNPNLLDKLLGGKAVKKQTATPTPTN